MCEFVHIWKELITEYFKCKTLKKSKENTLKMKYSIKKNNKSDYPSKSKDVKCAVEQWLNSNEKHRKFQQEPKTISEDNNNDKEFLQSLRVEILKRDHSNLNVNCSYSINRSLKGGRFPNRIYQSEEKVHKKIRRPFKNRPYTAHIFTPSDLNVSYINPVPWKKE